MWRMQVKALNGDGVNDTEGITGMERTAFKASGYAWRLYTGPQAIERGLVESVDRARAKRVFVVCSPSVNNRTDIVRRIEAELGERYAGVFDGIEKDSTYRSVVAAKEAAEEAGADLLIGAGGGSVLVATRVVAVYMGEDADPFEIMTQYPEGKPAYSPRLMAPKPPIFNIPTTPTSAMNRGGSGLKNPDLDHRMEYFDPKTRPQSIFIDDDALLSAPKDLIRSTATTVRSSRCSSSADKASSRAPLSRPSENQSRRWASMTDGGLPVFSMPNNRICCATR